MVENEIRVLEQVFLCLTIQIGALYGKGTELEEPFMPEALNQINERQGKHNNPGK